MMLKFIIPILFFSSAALADDAIICIYKNTGERFNIVTINGQDYIQWGTSEFKGVVSKFESPYLTITQYGDTATFRMVWNVKTGEAYGGVNALDGKKTSGEIICTLAP